MPGTSVIGLQWGDEAKGKLVDILTTQHDIVVRYQGGANAGHTVVAGDQTYKLHQIPSGILHPNVINVVTAGVVLNPPTVLDEIDGLVDRGIRVDDNLMLSDRAHLIFPWHFVEDRLLNESTADGENIGTTLRGIGPCYRDKVGRSFAIRLGDMYQTDFRSHIERIVEAKQRTLAGLNGRAEDAILDARKIYDEYSGYAERIEPHVADTTAFLLDAVEQNQRLLFEGAQGALLDVDHGTFPFVTSSNSSGVGVSSGSGIPGRWINRVIGVKDQSSPTTIHELSTLGNGKFVIGNVRGGQVQDIAFLASNERKNLKTFSAAFGDRLRTTPAVLGALQGRGRLVLSLDGLGQVPLGGLDGFSSLGPAVEEQEGLLGVVVDLDHGPMIAGSEPTRTPATRNCSAGGQSSGLTSAPKAASWSRYSSRVRPRNLRWKALAPASRSARSSSAIRSGEPVNQAGGRSSGGSPM